MLGTKELLPGTLDMLILKALSLGPVHGYGVLKRIEATSQGLLSLEQGSLCPALQRRRCLSDLPRPAHRCPHSHRLPGGAGTCRIRVHRLTLVPDC